MSKPYDYFVGLDVSQRMTSICVIDTDGKKFCEGKCNTRPEDICGWLTNRVLKGPHRGSEEAGDDHA